MAYQQNQDHPMMRGIAFFLQAVVIALAIWIGDSVQSLRETSALNTYKITQVQQTVNLVPQLNDEIIQLQFKVQDLEQKQADPQQR
jgi:hypothetical protein